MAMLLQQTTHGVQAPPPPVIIDWWFLTAEGVAYATAVIAVLILTVYLLRLFFSSGNKAKYDFITVHEVRHLFIASVFLVVSFMFFYNREINTRFTLLGMSARVFVTISTGVVLVMIIQAFLKFYYPFFIERRLNKLRFKPRISPKTGKPMKLLSEEEEDSYLDEGMQAEENVFSVDYDVWRDEETGFIQIEKYSGHLHALRCPECNYQTLKLVKEEIITEPTETYEGTLMKHYQCSYCGHKAKKSVVLRRRQVKAEG